MIIIRRWGITKLCPNFCFCAHQLEINHYLLTVDDDSEHFLTASSFLHHYSTFKVNFVTYSPPHCELHLYLWQKYCDFSSWILRMNFSFPPPLPNCGNAFLGPFPSLFFFSSAKKYFSFPNNFLIFLLLRKKNIFILQIFSSSSFSILLLLRQKIFSSFSSIFISSKKFLSPNISPLLRYFPPCPSQFGLVSSKIPSCFLLFSYWELVFPDSQIESLWFEFPNFRHGHSSHFPVLIQNFIGYGYIWFRISGKKLPPPNPKLLIAPPTYPNSDAGAQCVCMGSVRIYPYESIFPF